MTQQFRLSWLHVVVLAVSAIGFAVSAHAQTGGPMDPGQLLQHGANMAPDQSKPEVQQPPALPGAATRTGSAAPATRIPTDLSPNDALFDAINRGDIAAARDALSRGADLRARNTLGMTPMELSVDLSRNDISFLLLSYGAGQDGGGGGPAMRTAAGKQPPGKQAKPELAAKARPRGAPGPAVKAIPVAAPAQPAAPRLFANDGGAPVPSVGFLGFGNNPSQ